MSNHMPEVAKMLGVEYRPKEFDFEVEYAGWRKAKILETGLYLWGMSCGDVDTDSRKILADILLGRREIRPLPRYTIPEDLPVDSPVWVRDNVMEDWKPYHFAELHTDDDIDEYVVFAYGTTSFTEESCTAWRFCITDEEYQRRKKEGRCERYGISTREKNRGFKRNKADVRSIRDKGL